MPPKTKSNAKSKAKAKTKSAPKRSATFAKSRTFAPDLATGFALQKYSDGVKSVANQVNPKIVAGTSIPAQFYQTDKSTGVLIPMDHKRVHSNYGSKLGSQINEVAEAKYNSKYSSRMSLSGFEQGLGRLPNQGTVVFATDGGPITYTNNISDDIGEYPGQMTKLLQDARPGVISQAQVYGYTDSGGGLGLVANTLSPSRPTRPIPQNSTPPQRPQPPIESTLHSPTPVMSPPQTPTTFTGGSVIHGMHNLSPWRRSFMNP